VLAPGGTGDFEYEHMKLANLLAATGDMAGSAYALGLGFSHPLAPAVSRPLTPEMPADAAAGAAAVSIFDKALPVDLVKRLREAFHDTSSFWRAHDYPQAGYFSYYYPLATPPRNLVEFVIAKHLRPLVERAFGHRAGIGPDYVGAEWWVHKRVFDSSARYTHGHVLHFDSDQEAFYKRGVKRLSHVSSVLYLAADVGGPTLIIPETVDEHQLSPARHCWRAAPVQNRYVVFPGHYLHGVLPARRLEHNSSSAQRLTLLVAFWEVEGCSSPMNQQRVGPCMPLPSEIEDAPWLRDLSIQNLDTSMGRMDPAEVEPAKVGPVWI